MKILITLLLLFIPVISVADDAGPASITVSGFASVEEVADVAFINVAMRSISESISSARQVTDNSYSKLMDILGRQGVVDKDIKSSHTSQGKNIVMRNQTRSHEGFYAFRSVHFALNNIESYSLVLKTLAEDSRYEVSGYSFGYKNIEALKRTALLDALKVAKLKATDIAASLNLRLGSVHKVTEISRQRHRPEALGRVMMSQSSASPESNGVIETSAEVEVVYLFDK